MHGIFCLFLFDFILEIRTYKTDVVSLLSIDVITGSTVIPFIPHVEGIIISQTRIILNGIKQFGPQLTGNDSS